MELTKKELAFIDAIQNIGGMPEKLIIKFLKEDSDEFLNSTFEGEYSDHYTTIADCWSVFRDAIEYERKRCQSICEGAGDDGLDGHYCADEINRGEHETT
jgi:hypothetical protein